MSLYELSLRMKDQIATPVVFYGARFNREDLKTVAYRDPSLRRLIYEVGGNPTDYRAILTSNEIGSVFDGGLEEGMTLIIPSTKNTFSSHPEA